MNQDIDDLLTRYYEGETTLAEEKQLREFFRQETIPAYLQAHAAQFRYFAEARQQQPSAPFSRQLAEKLTAPKPGRVIGLTTWGMRIAASITLMLLGFAGGLLYEQGRTNPRGSLRSADDAPPVQTMKKVLAFAQQPKTSASERIQAVNQSYGLDQVDEAITQLLINTLNFDANVNVRLAACQALLRFESEPGVREALIQSLTIQTDPNVQITLIDILVTIKEKRAVREMQRLAQSQQAIEAVRVKAEEGINRLAAAANSPS